MHFLIHRAIPSSALRRLGASESPRVTNMELFFDLVYVFTIIQLSHYLLDGMTWMGAIEALTLFAAVWWTWNYTAWATNWLDPDHVSGRVLMTVLMGCALVMAIGIPEAYGDRAGLFAVAYVAMALLRAGYMSLLFRGQAMGRNYAQLFAWSAVSGCFWIAGALFPEQRILLWILAVLLDYAAPYHGFWLPALGSTSMASWPLRGLHLFERNQQIFIIALGESILLLGALLVGRSLDPPVVSAAIIGFLVIIMLWWIYFVQLAERGEHGFHHGTDHSRLARAGLAYAHGVMVCGAIIVAVAIELIVAHPLDPVHVPTALAAAAGPTLFLAGAALFHRTMSRRMPGTYGLAVLALPAWAWLTVALHLDGRWLGAGVLMLMTAVAIRQRGHGALA
ncbi:low temperature requirement protein A [Luteimonas aestuarii]|uniref:Low temperature requirement protein A n=1 Tax=Luteimonas aestuarii TaxID=453837 RepID=A0A4R5U4U1_9GAMM|nr:low temperature requirement protein A [Luteimonas aestuarii]